MARQTRVFSRDDIEALIANGNLVFILNQTVIKANAWAPYHPGGDKAIRHMVGRDATDEVQGLHSSSALKRMHTYRIGRIEGAWDNFLPPIQGGHFRTAAEIAAENETRSEDESGSSSPASEQSSLFDQSVRQRTRYSRSSSATSVSSVPEQTLKVYDPEQRTREEIEEDKRRYPSLDKHTQAEIVQKYRALDDRIRAEGLYQCNYWAYAPEVFRYTLLFVSFLLTLRQGWYAVSAVFIGLFWHQLVFTAHDAGHMGITHGFQTDTLIGIFIADFLGGLSIGWWKRNHNVHHIVTNSPEHDPDIEHIPMFAVSHRFLSSLRSTYYDRIMTYDAFAKFMIPYQHFLYYIILAFGRFNLYRLSYEYLILGLGPRKGPARWHRWLEIAGNVFFWTWFGYGVVYKSIPTAWDRFIFIMISHMVTAPLHVQITLSHFAMSTADLGVTESFPQKMLRTTMDVDCPQWLDFLHGGLQFQAIHHLYPRIPRHNLRRTQKLVQEFCSEVGIPYALYGFVEGNKQVIGRLGEVARQAEILAACQRTVASRQSH